MTDQEILDLAKQLGWNMEHEATNWMLVQFARALLEPEQKPWVGLTDEETITQANKEVFFEAFARGAIWAQLKLKEKNT